MEFTMGIANELSLNCILNLLAVGSTGETLEQFLGFLDSESVGQLNARASQMVALASSAKKNIKDQEITPSNRNSIKDAMRRMRGHYCLFVNGVWIEHMFPMKPSFQKLAKTVYKAKAKTVDF